MLVPGNLPGSICCWWAEDILEEQVLLTCQYWQASLVPEENHDRGLIEFARRHSISIYARQEFNKREQEVTKFLGWKTTEQTRKRAVTTRESVRNEIGGGYEVRCPWIIEQMRNFGTKPNGRMEALSGHDDDVISLAIGVFCLDFASLYALRHVERVLPRDLQHIMDARQAEQVPSSYA